MLASLPGLMLLRDAAAAPTKVSVGTASEGGAFVLYGGALIDALKSVEPSLEMRERMTRGTLDNVPMLERGELDIGSRIRRSGARVVLGRRRSDDEAHRHLGHRIPLPACLPCVPTAATARSPIFEGRPVVWNARGSGLAVQGRYVMSGMGLDVDTYFDSVYPEQLSDGPTMVIDGTASALRGGGLRWPGFVTIANNPNGVRFVVPTPEETDRILAKYDFLRRFTVPAGLYAGQSEPIQSVGSWSFILARADLDETVGYRLAAGLHRVERAGLSPRQLGQSTAKNTLAAVSSPDVLHPGVRRFYQEQGLIK